jgi:hypothetical protein
MNDPQFQPDPELDSLFAQMRTRRTNTSSMEYGFETRLMARLRERKNSGSVWALVSWRMMPFFAACMLMLVVWREQEITATDDAAQAAYLENSTTLESANTSDL